MQKNINEISNKRVNSCVQLAELGSSGAWERLGSVRAGLTNVDKEHVGLVCIFKYNVVQGNLSPWPLLFAKEEGIE